MDRGYPLFTYTGREFYVLDPRVEDVCLEDMAHHLGLLSRWAGACRTHYAIAEHSVRVAWCVAAMDGGKDPWVQLAAHLHDGAEAYVVDLPRPVKSALPAYQAIEHAVQEAVYDAFHVPAYARLSPLIKAADEILLATEARDLMAPPPRPWTLNAPPLKARIEPWTAREAEVAFLGLARRLIKETQS